MDARTDGWMNALEHVVAICSYNLSYNLKPCFDLYRHFLRFGVNIQNEGESAN